MIVIEDEWHADHHGEFQDMESAIAELRRRAEIPWDEQPNLAPCGSWRTCGRAYYLIEYDETRSELRRTKVLEVSAFGVTWAGAFADDTTHRTDDIRRSARKAFWLAAVRREFGLLLSDELPELAATALAAGLDSTELRLLAGELHPSWASVGALFDNVLRDRSIKLPHVARPVLRSHATTLSRFSIRS